MRYAVLRPFNSPSRRFAVAQIVEAEEIDGQMTAEELEQGGFIAPENPAAPVKPLTMKRATLPPPIELENDNGIV